MSEPFCNHDSVAVDADGRCECGVRVPDVYVLVERVRYTFVVPVDYKAPADTADRGLAYAKEVNLTSGRMSSTQPGGFPVDRTVAERYTSRTEVVDAIGFCRVCGRDVQLADHDPNCRYIKEAKV